jgi:hypothetical protein
MRAVRRGVPDTSLQRKESPSRWRFRFWLKLMRLLANRRQICRSAMRHLRRLANALAQRGMRVNRQTEVW